MNFTYRMQHVVLRGDLKKPLDLYSRGHVTSTSQCVKK